jgi:hypothetical protein
MRAAPYPLLALLAAAGAALATSPAAAAPGAVDWQRRVVRCSGSGAPELEASRDNVAVARIGAEKAARLDALRSCLEAVKGIRLASGATVAGAVAGDAALLGRVEGEVRGFQVVGAPRYYSDGGVELDVEVSIDAILAALSAPAPAAAAQGAAAAPAARTADAGVQVVEAEGQGPIDGDVQAARARAKDDALRGCVEQVATTVVTAATETDQARLLSDRIYAHALGYVRKYQILDDRQDGSAWVTRLRCEVSEGKLDEDLLAFGIAYRRAGMPRIFVLVAEQAVNATQASGWWQGGGNAADLRVVENAFMDRMERSGFTFVDPEVLSGKVRLEAIGADPNVAAARELALKGGAEVVVIGRAVAKPLGELPIEGGTFYSAVANVSARAVKVDTGEVLAAVELTGPAGRGFEQATAGRNALSEAGKALARELFARIGARWKKEQSGATRVQLLVKGVDDYGRLQAFKGALSTRVSGVRDVVERSMGGGEAELDVLVAGTSQAFATALATRRFDGYAVRVRRVTSGLVEVELR